MVQDSQYKEEVSYLFMPKLCNVNKKGSVV